MSLENRVQRLEADKQASLSPEELPIKATLGDDDFALIHNSATDRVERTPKSNVSNFVVDDAIAVDLSNTNADDPIYLRVVQWLNNLNPNLELPAFKRLTLAAYYIIDGYSVKQTWDVKRNGQDRVFGQGQPQQNQGILEPREKEETKINARNEYTIDADLGVPPNDEQTGQPISNEQHVSNGLDAVDDDIALDLGYVINATFDGVLHQFYFTGNRDTYGSGNAPTEADNFQEFDYSQNAQDTPQAIQTTSLKPFNYLIESTKDPVLIEASVGGWDETLRELGNYFLDDDGKIYQLYTGYTGASGVNSRLGIAVSLDNGETFQKAGINDEGMMFDTPSEDPYMYKVGKTYYLYSEESSNNAKKIQLHTCTNLLDNSWVSQGIVIDTGFPDDDWDGESVGSPMGLYKDGMHIVFYEGLNQSRYQYGQIGVATGVDPTNLTKQASPIIIGKDFNDKFPNLFQGDVTIPWADTVVCDDIYFSNGIYYMTIHANTKGFKPAVLYSKDLFDGWTDLLGGYLGSNGDLENNRDIMFSPYNGEMRVTKISRDRKRITRAELSVQGDYTLKNRPFESDGDIISNGEIKSENLISVNDAIAMNGQDFYVNDKDAHDNGVEWNQVYRNEFKIPIIRKEVFNLFPDSEPTAAPGPSTTFVDFDWQINGFTKALQTGDNSSQTGYLENIDVVSGVRYNFSCYVKMDDDTAPVYYPQSNVIISDFILYVAGNFQDIPTNIEDLGNNIYRVSANAKATATGSRLFGISKFTTNSPRPFKTYGFQATRGEYVNDYRPTYNPSNDNEFEDLTPVQTTGRPQQTILGDLLELIGFGTGTAGRTRLRIKNESSNSAARIELFNNLGRGLGIQATGPNYPVLGETVGFSSNEDVEMVFGTNGNNSTGGTKGIVFSPGGFAESNKKFAFSPDGSLSVNKLTADEKLDINGNGIADSFITRPVTVANLPTGQQGMYATVTDALAPTSGGVIVGGGTDTRPVHHNGTDWISLY